MDDQQTHIDHPGQAHLGDEDIAVGLSAPVQDSEFNSVLRRAENESESQELGGGVKSPIPHSGNMGGDAQDDNEAVDYHLPPANAEASGGGSSAGSPLDQSIKQADNHSQDASILVQMTEDDTAVGSDGDVEVDDNGEGSGPERDDEVNQHSCIDDNDDRIHDYPRTRQIIAEHLSIQGQHAFKSLDDLLASHNSPGRGLYRIEQVFEAKSRKAADLEEDIRCLQAQLDVVSELRDQAQAVMLRACVAFSDTRGAAGIFDELWAEYEAFCESLESNFGSRDGWSVTCFHDHHNSYVQWDPYLDLFKDTAEMPLEDCNFRCEAATITKNGSTEYIVEFWPLFRLEPREGTADTWEQQYVSGSVHRTSLTVLLTTS